MHVEQTWPSVDLAERKIMILNLVCNIKHKVVQGFSQEHSMGIFISLHLIIGSTDVCLPIIILLFLRCLDLICPPPFPSFELFVLF